MKLNKHMKALVKALIATASEPLKKHIEDLEYQVKCANAKATNLEDKLKAAEENCCDLKAKNAELSSELSKAEIDLSLAIEARDAAEDRANNLNISYNRLAQECIVLKETKIANSWISTKDKLPKHKQKVVIIYYARNYDNYLVADTGIYQNAKLPFFDCELDGTVLQSNVLLWQPFPEPPKDKK